jgi:hypothetical protein
VGDLREGNQLTGNGRRALKAEASGWDAYVKAVASVMRATPEPA